MLTNFCLINDVNDPSVKCDPETVQPIGFTADRQWYLYENIRELVPVRAKDIVCPKPLCLRHTFAQTRKEQKSLSFL